MLADHQNDPGHAMVDVKEEPEFLELIRERQAMIHEEGIGMKLMRAAQMTRIAGITNTCDSFVNATNAFIAADGEAYTYKRDLANWARFWFKAATGSPHWADEANAEKDLQELFRVASKTHLFLSTCIDVAAVIL